MMINTVYKTFLIVSLFSAFSTQAQSNVRDFLILGVDAAEDIVGKYTAPASEGLMYGLTGGWYNTAQVKDAWSVDVSLVGNGSFVPSENRSFTLDTSRFDNLTTAGGEATVKVPTILGGSIATILLIASLDDEDFEFESPEGVGLLDANLLPTAFLQVKVGMPKATEVGFRFFPKVSIDDNIKIGVIGFGAQHEFSRWIPAIDESNFALSALVSFTSLFGEYNFDLVDNNISGSNEKIDVGLDSWLFEMIASTTFPILNVYGGIGYVSGTASTKMLGTYSIQTQIQTIQYVDPFEINNDVSGIRANIGVKVRMGWFSLNTDYTFQGYNNLSLGLNFRVN